MSRGIIEQGIHVMEDDGGMNPDVARNLNAQSRQKGLQVRSPIDTIFREPSGRIPVGEPSAEALQTWANDGGRPNLPQMPGGRRG